MPIKSAKTAKSVAMAPAEKQALAEVRAQIDQLDAAMHDFLIKRAELVEQVRKIKGKQHICIRPGREAQMLRVLAGRPQGKLPEGLTVRLWREIISAFTLQESAVKASVYAPEKGDNLWDLARDYLGSFTPLLEAKNAVEAIKAVQTQKADIAVVPHPAAGEKDSWWPLLAGDKTNNLTVFAILPFEPLKQGRSNARHALPSGLVIGRHYPDLTGDDRSFLSLQTVHVPEAEMKRLLSKAGYKVRQLLMQTKGRSGSAPSFYLAEVDGYVGRSDTRLARVKAMMGSRLQALTSLGGYPVPLKAGRR